MDEIGEKLDALLNDPKQFGKIAQLASSILGDGGGQQISKNIKNCESNICSSLKTASVFGSNTVKPSHTSWTACSSTKFTAVTATSSQFICFIAKDFRNKCTCSYCTGVCLAYSNNLFDLIWWKTCSYCTISCQGRGRCNHRIKSMIRIFQRTKLSLKKHFLTFF